MVVVVGGCVRRDFEFCQDVFKCCRGSSSRHLTQITLMGQKDDTLFCHNLYVQVIMLAAKILAELEIPSYEGLLCLDP